jgi:competence protein ComEC
VVISTLRGRCAPRFHPIAAAGLLVLALEPDALFQGGAQLSFAACAALVWGAGRESAGGTSRWRSALHGSSLAVAVTAPLAAWHWGTAAPLAVWINLIAIPWTAALLLPAALLATALAALVGDAPSAVLDGLALLAAWSLRAGHGLAAWLPPLRQVEVHPAALLAAAALGGLALRSRSALGSAALAGGIGLLLRCAPPPAYAPPPPRLVAFDVGRGDAVLVQGRTGALLVDGAAAYAGHFDLGRSALVPALRALRVGRLDRVVATHADLDHRGGLPSVLRALPVDGLWLPPGGRADPDFAALRAVARARGVAIQEVGRGAPELQLGDLRVRPIWPPLRHSRSVAQSRNEASLGLRIELSGRRILLLGDLGRAEAALLDAGGSLAADVLLLPHHGSAGSSSAALLRAVSPSLALVSAPCPPRRGLPHAESLTRARAAGASVWWTGRDGALFVGLGRPLVALPFADRRACGAPDPASPFGPPRADQRSIPSTSRS